MTVVEGYRRAAAMGMYDDLDTLVPVLYLGTSGQNATEHVHEVLTVTAGNKTRSSGEPIVMSPVLSWLLFPSGCAASFDQIHDAVAEIERLSGVLAPQPMPVAGRC